MPVVASERLGGDVLRYQQLDPVQQLGGGGFLLEPGRLACHTQWQNFRPWKNVRFAPSAIKLLFVSFAGTPVFDAQVEIEYLRSLPWWRDPPLRDRARGL